MLTSELAASVSGPRIEDKPKSVIFPVIFGFVGSDPSCSISTKKLFCKPHPHSALREPKRFTYPLKITMAYHMLATLRTLGRLLGVHVSKTVQ
jgi:hypothetical protein